VILPVERTGTRLLRGIAFAGVAAVVPSLVSGVTGIASVWFLVLGTGACYAMMALSLNLLMGYAGQISLGHAGLLAAGAYTSGLLTGRADLPFLVGLMAAALVGGAVAFLVGLPALRLRGLLLAVTTIAFVVAMERSVLQIPWLSRGSAGVTMPRPVFGPLELTENAAYLGVLLVLLAGVWVLDSHLTRSWLGRAFAGIRDDEQVAASYGVDVARTKLVAFVLSGAVAGVAGAAYGHLLLFVNSATFPLQFSLSLVAWVIIGGLGSRIGVVVAGVLFGVTPIVFERIFEYPLINDYLLVFGAALLLFTIAVNPNGFAGSIRAHREERDAEAAREALGRGAAELGDAGIPSLPVPARAAGAAAPAPGSTVLEVRDVTVRFGGLTAVDGASLTVREGEIVGLIGPNGAGKTTLFDAIGGFGRPEAGIVRLRGRDLGGLSPHQRAVAGLGRTFQRTGLATGMSTRGNLLLAMHDRARAGYDGVSALLRGPACVATEAGLEARVDEVVDALQLGALADLPVSHLSGGQRRIVELACTLATAPELLMLDEPTAGMAPAAVEELAERLRDLRDVHGRTILLIEHHVPLVLDVCDRIVVLDHGRVIAEGDPDTILASPEVLRAYLGERAAAQAGLGAAPEPVREEVLA
jgi:ABC-type branched-subunit amino acid transport system ATPase component/ABC-type branched-subunit amino acid transport system permease subunit